MAPACKPNLVPVSIREANAFVAKYHRRLKALRVGYVAAVGLAFDGQLIGVAVLGRPCALALNDGYTLELRRLAVRSGHPNACSMLLAAARRAAVALGYRRTITYTQQDEPGTSLRAAGWRLDGVSSGRPWDRKSRPRPRALKGEKRNRWVAPEPNT